jgi:hypothetical protein
MMITGCYWSRESQENLWINCLERIANNLSRECGVFIKILHNLRLYPALLLLYGGGIASIAAKKYDMFSSLLHIPRIISLYDGETIPAERLNIYSVIDYEHSQKLLPSVGRLYTPLSDHLYEILRGPFREILPQDIRYQECFDRFEYLFALVHADLF